MLMDRGYPTIGHTLHAVNAHREVRCFANAVNPRRGVVRCSLELLDTQQARFALDFGCASAPSEDMFLCRLLANIPVAPFVNSFTICPYSRPNLSLSNPTPISFVALCIASL